MMTIISNGYCKFHLSVLAAEVARRNALDLFLTGAYPIGLAKIFSKLGRVTESNKMQRLAQRREAIPDRLIRSYWMPELLYHSRRVALRCGFGELSRIINARAFSSYGRRAAHALRSATVNSRIYHYRAGMGGVSVEVAKERGMIALCDHSIAHPAVLEYMIQNLGRYPVAPLKSPVDPVERIILADLHAADHILVNSDFVKETLVFGGFDEAKLSVVYLGVDDQFTSSLPDAQLPSSGDANLLFAGALTARKGAGFLSEALCSLVDLPWKCVVAGASTIPGELAFSKLDRVQAIGFLSRSQLARAMSAADIFIFPSLAEGSARVIFEALAAGCYVITTPNSGSIVRDGQHGALVPPGDVDALQRAIREALADIDRTRSIGQNNGRLVASEYSQRDYADRVMAVYTHLLKA